MTPRPRKPRFSGGFKTFTVSVSTNREKGTDSRLCVFSQGSRAKVIEYLWLKWIWDELSKDEMKLVYASSEFLTGVKQAALRAVFITGKRKVREKLLSSPIKEEISKTRYQGFKRLDIEIYEFQRSLPKVPKFSGYVRNASSVGSKRSSGGTSVDLSPLDIIEDDYNFESFNWYTFLTVGDNRVES